MSVEEFQELKKQRDQLKSKIVQTETILSEKEKEYKTILAEIKEAGVDTKDLKGWRNKLTSEIEQNVQKLQTLIADLNNRFDEYESL